MTDYEKHTTSTDALDTLGSIIDEGEKRDAIHLAVEPAIAGETLRPGQHVNLEKGIATAADLGQGVGIVDPFLETLVSEGQRFWLVVYPRQISSLRHVWEHPAFPPSGETDVKKYTTEEETAAAQYLRNFAKENYFDFETLINAATGNHHLNDEGDGYNYTSELKYDNDGSYLHFNGQDAHGKIPDEFWENLSIYTGKDYLAENNPSHFSCSC